MDKKRTSTRQDGRLVAHPSARRVYLRKGDSLELSIEGCKTELIMDNDTDLQPGHVVMSVNRPDDPSACIFDERVK